MAIVTDDRQSSGYIFTFELQDLEGTNHNGIPNEITLVRWKLEGNLRTCPICGMPHTAHFEGTTPLKKLAIGQDYVPLEELTENQILGWVKDLLWDDLHPFMAIARQIEAKHAIGTSYDGGPMPKSWVGKI